MWRTHYLAAILDDIPPHVMRALEDRGFETVAFTAAEPEWAVAFKRLAIALGAPNDTGSL